MLNYRIGRDLASSVIWALQQMPTPDNITNAGLSVEEAHTVIKSLGYEAIYELCQASKNREGNVNSFRVAQAIVGIDPKRIESLIAQSVPGYKLPQPKHDPASRPIRGEGIWYRLQPNEDVRAGSRPIGVIEKLVDDPDNPDMFIVASADLYAHIDAYPSIFDWFDKFENAVHELLDSDSNAVNPLPDMTKTDFVVAYIKAATSTRSSAFSPQLAFAQVGNIAYEMTRPEDWDAEAADRMIGTNDYNASAFSFTKAGLGRVDGREEQAHNARRRWQLAEPAVNEAREQAAQRQGREAHPALAMESEQAMDLFDEITHHIDAIEAFNAGADDLDAEAQAAIVEDLKNRSETIFSMIDSYSEKSHDEAGSKEARDRASSILWEKLIDADTNPQQLTAFADFMPA